MGVPTGYTPSQYAKVWNVIAPNAPGGSAHLCLDILQYDTALGTMIDFALLQQAPNGTWNYLGNMPPATPEQGNYGLLWEATIGVQMIYNPPTGPGIQGGFSDIANQVRDDMVCAWMARIAQIIREVLFGEAPTPSPWPVGPDAWQQAVTNLQFVLRDRIEIVNGVPVVKA